MDRWGVPVGACQGEAVVACSIGSRGQVVGRPSCWHAGYDVHSKESVPSVLVVARLCWLLVGFLVQSMEALWRQGLTWSGECSHRTCMGRCVVHGSVGLSRATQLPGLVMLSLVVCW